MLVFKCPYCEGKMQASEEHAGQTVVCPDCQATTKVPSGADPTAIKEEPRGSVPASKGDAITTPERLHLAKSSEDDDEEEDDRPRRRGRPSADAGAGQVAAAGMGIGMILLLVFGIGACVLCVPAILIALLVPAVQKVREAAARTTNTNNLKQISLAVINFHDAKRNFPSPKMQPDLPGTPPADLSWRVSILPFIEQEALFNQFDKKNGWDHPNNKMFLSRRPTVYGNVQRPDVDNTQTVFQYFTGPKTLFPDPLKTQWNLGNIPDGSSNTLLLAEAQTAVPWMKPADMVMAPNAALPLPPERFLAAMADGSVRLIDRRKTSDATLHLAIQPNDGQQLGGDWDR